MQKYRKTSHSVYDIKYHLVWITKYRKKVLVGELANRVRELLRQICKANEVEKKSYIEGSCAHVGISITSYFGKRTNTKAKRKEFTEGNVGIQEYIKTILGKRILHGELR